MSSSSGGNIKMALQSIRTARWRSLLTMFGIIVGIVSVVTTVSLGEGVKKQVANQIKQLGNDLIIIRPGKTVQRDSQGNITGINFFAGLGASTLTENDLGVIRNTPNIRLAVPLNLISGIVRANDNQFDNGFIIATSEQMPEILNQRIEYGEFFMQNDSQKHLAVIGKEVARNLFEEQAPLGKTLMVRGQNFIVVGIFEEFPSNPLTPAADFNSAVFIPYATGKVLSGGSTQIYEVLAKSDDASRNSTIDELNVRLKAAHGGQEDFTILKQEETLAITSTVLNLLTGLIAGVAAISLIVGGVGIMNIMLVSVTERTHEIGVRKAVGATNRQIMVQFLTESIVICIIGGIIGIGLSGVINLILRITTDMEPIITPQTMAIAVGISVVVGAVFGAMPAVRAARKDPIEALRYE